MLAHDNKDIRQAYTLLEVISQDKHKRMAYEAREAELMDQRSRILSAEMKGIEKGREEGVRVVAKNMLTRGMPVGEVANMTGMDRNALVALQRQMQTEQTG
jgi:predicted transposase/invertase (TIGR01784 family)